MKTAFVFPGQGSQAIGMLANISAEYPLIAQTFKEASDVLGYDLWDLVQNGEAAQLNQTEITQPALLTTSVALWRVHQSLGGDKPEFMAGHSLGEYSALVCANVLSFADAVNLVKLRGQFMQDAVPAGLGGMAAIIGLSDELVIEACEEAAQDQVASAVNFNSPGQVVIAGNKEAIDRACVIVKEKGAKRALPLNVSAPSHCSLMKPAAEKLAKELESIEFKTPEIAVVQNVCATVESDPAKIKQNLIEQLYLPVLWSKSVSYMVDQSVETTVECGPGKVLSGLNRRIHKGLSVANIELPADMQALVAK
ncbi:ACP S-malonyltransferase [Marinicellulosiphila megalodicopiae]|uniref:ACP S-malonyltransferase n=1 Tax=Marinicellulosiphila megalodicopiae TaxID=2724896 RepID=UPI003BAEB5C5